MTATDAHLRCPSQTLAWQGWRLTVPAAWNPVKVDGDADGGAVLLADLHSARLGLRWKRAARRGDPAAWATRALRDEVGPAAAERAVDHPLPDAADWSASRIYLDRALPGRDVWVGQSRRSGRVLQIVHHAARRGPRFADAILPSLVDTAAGEAVRWSMFDLSLVTPPGLSVRWYRFNAGDLALGLIDAKRRLTVVRQVGPAGLALGRQPLERWITQTHAATRKLYHPTPPPEPVTLDVHGRRLDGLGCTLRRKRRVCWAWMIAPRQRVLAVHDAARDRLLIGQSADEPLLRELLATAGWARPSERE